MWADRGVLSPGELDLILARVDWLLREDRAIGVIAFAAAEPRAYGISVFVTEQEAEAIMRRRLARIGSRLLLSDRFPRDILDHDDVARRNASGEGLQLVVASVHYRPELGQAHEVLGVMMRAFMDLHQGYRLRRVFNEVFGEPAIAAMTANGSYEMFELFEDGGRVPVLRSELGIVTRESAMRGTVGLLPMFVYAPPVVRYTSAERKLLKLALSGGTDETLRIRLGASLTAVKSRWLRIQERTARRLPQLFKEVAHGPVRGGRGAQTRHIVLDYVRRHPSELTPYDSRFEPAP
jgi:hypothetical protein